MTNCSATPNRVRLFRASSSLLVMAAVVAIVLATPLLGRAEVVPPTLDVSALHGQWLRDGRVSSDCVWADVRVDRRRQATAGELVFGTLAEAIAYTDRSARICGPTIRMGTGRHRIGQLEIKKPTILVGDDEDVVLVGTLINVTGAPMWIQGLSVEDAPFPGALVVMHPDSDVAVVRVLIQGARGFGIVQRGGRLVMSKTRVVRTQVATERDFEALGSLPLPDPAALPRPDRGDFTLGLTMAAEFDRSREMGSGYEIRANAAVAANALWIHFDWGLVLPVLCSGTGAIMAGPVYAEMFDTTLAGNSRAGLLVSGTGAWVSLVRAAASLNGYPSGATAEEIQQQGMCMGGIYARDFALLLGQDMSLWANAESGVLVRTNAVAGIDLATLVGAQSPTGSLGDNATVDDAFLALNHSTSMGAVRAGVLFSESTGNLVNGSSTGNTFGLVFDGGVYLSNFDVSGNTTQDILKTGDLPVPDDPSPVPPAP